MTFFDELRRRRKVAFDFVNHQIETWPKKRFGIDDLNKEINRFARNPKNIEALVRFLKPEMQERLRALNLRLQKRLAHLRSIQTQLDERLDGFIEMARRKPSPPSSGTKRTTSPAATTRGTQKAATQPARKAVNPSAKVKSLKKSGAKRRTKKRAKANPKTY